MTPSVPPRAASRPRRPRPGWFELPLREQTDIVAMAILVPLTHVLVRVIDYRRTMALAEWTSVRWPFRRRPGEVASAVESLRLATARVQRYSRLPGNCLSRSLSLWWLLRRCDLNPHLQFGVSLEGGTFAAHAWVELNGRVLNDSPDVSSRYAPLKLPRMA